MSRIPSNDRLQAFICNLLGVDPESVNPDSIWEKISYHQEEIQKLISSLQKQSNLKDYQIESRHIESVSNKFPFLNTFQCNGPIAGHRNRNYVDYTNMPFHVYAGNFSDTNSIPFYGVFWLSAPVYRYRMHLLEGRLSWDSNTGLFIAPGWGHREKVEALETEAPKLYVSYTVEDKNLDQSAGTPVEMAAHSIMPLPSREGAYTHPHSNDSISPMQSVRICVGDRDFRREWGAKTITTASEFIGFLNSTSFWISHFNIADSYSSRAEPLMVGAPHRDLVSDGMFDVCLDLMDILHKPLFRYLDQMIAVGPNVLEDNLWPTDESPFDADTISRLEECVKRLEELPWILTSTGMGLSSFLIEGQEYTEGELYSFGDSCKVALDNAISINPGAFKTGGDAFWTMSRFRELQAFRDLAYTIIMLKLTDPGFSRKLGLSGSGLLSNFGKENFRNMLKFSILCGNLMNPCPHTNAVFKSLTSRGLDTGFDRFRATRMRIVSPYTFYRILLHSENDAQSVIAAADSDYQGLSRKLLETLSMGEFSVENYI